MAIDGLIILDSTGRAIIQSGFRSNSASYPLLHIDAVNNALQKSTSPVVDPVLYVPAYNADNKPSACCHRPCGDMRFLCPISGDVDPLFAFSFLQTFINILIEYFGTVNAATLKDNFDVVYQLLEETLDAGGYPLTTYPNALREIVLPPSLLTKLLNVAGANLGPTINSNFGMSGPFSSPIPWRKSQVKYTNNEIYFDLVEELKGVVNKHGTPVSTNVWGRIETNAKLSGTPDCTLSFANAQLVTDYALHPCVRLQRWSRDKVMSFIPPDGKFVLAEYRLTSTAALPLSVKTIVNVDESSATLDVTLLGRLAGYELTNVLVDIHLGQSATGIKCTTNGSGKGSSSSWMYDSKTSTMKWEIPVMGPMSNWNMRISFNSMTPPRPAHAVRVRYEISSYTYSALKVDQLRVNTPGMGENYKPYKGVRGRAIGDVEWRW